MAFLVTSLLTLTGATMLLVTLLLRCRKEVVGLRQDLAGTRADLVRQLREAEWFRMACEHANDGIVIQNIDGTVVWPNPAYCRIMGRTPEDIIGRNPLEFALPPEETPSPEDIRAFRYDPEDPVFDNLQLFRNLRSDGTLFWNQLSVSFRKSAVGDPHAILVCRDVTQQIEQEARLREASASLAHEATHDSLTGLANRAAFLGFIDRALKDARTGNHQIGLLHIDLDHFKEINDTHGHSAGDAALVHVAEALRTVASDTCLVARVGGDEFVVAHAEISDLDSLQEQAAYLLARITRPYEWNDRNFVIQCSIGAALSRPGETDAEALHLHTDFALYEAKRTGRGRIATYDEALHRRHMQEQLRASELADAIDTASLDHVFQPTFDLVTQQVTGFETLVRWNHPEEGMIGPDTFLPMAAELGLMGALDLGSMTAALEQKHKLDHCGHKGLTLAFNASSDLLGHPDFINRLVWGVEAGGLTRSSITIEVLETTAFGDASENSSHAATIRDLRDAGFKVHLDDFGVGYAGLAHLAQLAVTGVKIDRTLISNLMGDSPAPKIVRKIIELCQDLGLDVIAEGVETRQIAEKLQEMGCNVIQGYWISKPLQEPDLLPWLEAHHATAPIPRMLGT